MGANSSSSTTTGGLRVHRVYPNGPGEEAGIEVFFDYILEADGNAYNDDSDDTLMHFTKYVNSQEGKGITLTLFNARKKTIRTVALNPRKWDGVGLLGLSVKFSEFTAMDEGVRVVMVHDGSPASKANLLPMTDYLLGTNLQLFIDLDCVRIHVVDHIGEEVTLWVYNSITETLRKTVIVPKEDWGGQGTLGCDLANGYIHRIPYVKAIWSVPSIDEYVHSERDQESIELSLTKDKDANEPEPYLPPSIVDLDLSNALDNTH